MGNAIIKTGGVGADSDELTANKEHVLTGYTAITHDSDGDPITGTMPNRGVGSHAVNSGINEQGVWYYIPPGYYPGSSTDQGNCWVYRTQAEVAATAGLTAGKLMKNQSALGIAGTATSDANATKDKILTGSSAYVNGVKINGELSIQSVVNFKVAQGSTHVLIATWARPQKGPWSGLRILCKQGGYPANVNDGTVFYEGSDTDAVKYLTLGTWYIRAWNYITTNKGRLYGSYHSAIATNKEIKGQQIFTSSGTFTVPDKVYEIDLFLVGAGGSGGKSTYYESEGQGGPGGCGGFTVSTELKVNPGSVHTINIGAPVAASSANNGINKSGSTSFDDIIAEGGESAYTWQKTYPGWHGGSGGGHSGESRNIDAGDGGSDGSNGISHGSGMRSGTGQQTTTRAFGEANATVYAGGGGGGGYNTTGTPTSGKFGVGGAGGGGDGGYGSLAANRLGKPGTANTGGGGGGGGCVASGASNWEGGLGGTGICIVRWGYKMVV